MKKKCFLFLLLFLLSNAAYALTEKEEFQEFKRLKLQQNKENTIASKSDESSQADLEPIEYINVKKLRKNVKKTYENISPLSITAGGTLFNLLSEQIGQKSTPALGLYVGLAFNFLINDMFSFHPEIRYSLYANTLKVSDSFTLDSNVYQKDTLGNLHFNSIQLPLVWTQKLTKHSGLVYGPYFSYLLSYSEEDENTFKTNGQTTKTEKIITTNLKNYNRFGYGLTIGYFEEVDRIQFGFAYDFALSNLNKSNSVEVKHNGFTLGISF